MLVLAEDEVPDGLVAPLDARLVVDRVVAKEPLEEEVLREESLHHVPVHLLLVGLLCGVVPRQVVGLQYLAYLRPVERPMLEGADPGAPLTGLEVLVYEVVLVLVLYV